MPPMVIDVRAAEDTRDVVHRAVQAISEGKLVVFPTETVYGIAARALDADAVDRLLAVKGRKEGHPLTLAIRSDDEARDYAPQMTDLARRLARRCWPGPVTLVVDGTQPDSLLSRLPDSVRQAVAPAGTVGLRVPGHEIILEVLRMVSGPLVLSSANRSGQPDAQNAQQAIDALGEDVQLVLDDGPGRFGQPSSVVRVDGEKLDILRAGVVPEKTLQRLTAKLILFVCTGNTCRSPMAEAICRSHLLKRFACDGEELENRGFLVMSAGVAAMNGSRASSHAVEVMSAGGIDIADHEAQPLTESLVRYADQIFTMTASHRQAIVAQWPGAAERTSVLCADGSDISDPIGGPVERYKQCAEQMDAEIRRQLDEGTV